MRGRLAFANCATFLGKNFQRGGRAPSPSLAPRCRHLFILGLLLLRCLAVAIVKSNDVARNPTRHQSCRALDENNWNLRSSRSKTIRGGFAGCVTALSVLEKLTMDSRKEIELRLVLLGADRFRNISSRIVLKIRP